MTGIDSEAWQCQDCGGQFIGDRTPDDLCGPCIAGRLARPGEVVRYDVGGWISGPSADTGPVPVGPYETEREARVASLWATHGREHQMSIEAANLAQLAAELSVVELGAWDKRIIEWLAGYEPSTVTVICGLIRRARAAGQGGPA
jgi:hypothetical protein